MMAKGKLNSAQPLQFGKWFLDGCWHIDAWGEG
jgi:hypothetical protein